MSTEATKVPVEETTPGTDVPVTEVILEKVEEAAQEVAKEVKKYATEAIIELDLADKLVISKLENEFLRAQTEIKRLTEVVKAAQERFPQIVNSFVEKYAISPVTHVFDNVELHFRRK